MSISVSIFISQVNPPPKKKTSARLSEMHCLLYKSKKVANSKYIWVGILILQVEKYTPACLFELAFLFYTWAEMIILQVANSPHPCLFKPTYLFYKFKNSPPEGLF